MKTMYFFDCMSETVQVASEKYQGSLLDSLLCIIVNYLPVQLSISEAFGYADDL